APRAGPLAAGAKQLRRGASAFAAEAVPGSPGRDDRNDAFAGERVHEQVPETRLRRLRYRAADGQCDGAAGHAPRLIVRAPRASSRRTWRSSNVRRSGSMRMAVAPARTTCSRAN